MSVQNRGFFRDIIVLIINVFVLFVAFGQLNYGYKSDSWVVLMVMSIAFFVIFIIKE